MTTDTIADPIRNPVLARILRSRDERRMIAEGRQLDEPTPARLRLYTLLTCRWCAGFWITGAVVAVAYFFADTIAFQLAAALLTASYAVGWLADNEAGE